MIVPCAAPLGESKTRPKWLLTTPDGKLLVQQAASCVTPSQIGRTVIVFLRETEERFACAEACRRAFGGEVECLVLDQPTGGPADTVREAIARLNIAGPVCIKDSDSYFAPVDLPANSFVAVTDIRTLSRLSMPAKKGFVLINEQNLISSMAERNVCSNMMSCGLYGFADARVYTSAFDQLVEDCGHRRLFVSHVVDSALADSEVFLPIAVAAPIDIETLADWADLRARNPILVLDIDGVIFRNQSKFFAPFWNDPVEPIAENVAHIIRLQKRGAQLVFVTSRPESLRERTLADLTAAGLRVHALVMGCNHGTRYLVNDFATSNAYPSAIAVNLERNRGMLPHILMAEIGAEETPI
jgi:hypothetical protein